eukprot:TRINITY_DN223_c0_g1_i10.p1 TRINITY_DN223_c0_g1~~TRINITY_DN223_c0_g1_i10.p1  ORF type:complete len:143 (-),score=18.32 TRINITY_DN223_c0_g1_i10:64-492(-)
MTSVRIIQHRVLFFDGRPEEVNDCSTDTGLKNWLKGKGAASIVVQGTSQQEFLRFRVEGAPVKGFTRTNKTTKFYIPVSVESHVLGDFDVGEHEYAFPKQDIEDMPLARARFSLESTFHDADGKKFHVRESSFELVAPRPAQ